MSDAVNLQQADRLLKSQPINPWVVGLFWASCVFVLAYHLGSAALFEPDEGRNAEKAREILVLNDWVTPYENFVPVLDKPIFFYWLIALAYKLFGVSEWSARLPSALAALGCIALVYRWARAQWGDSETLWGGLILLGSAEFFILSRVVIFDMALTFFITLALFSLYEAAHETEEKRKRIYSLLLYGSLGAATLIKGLVGAVMPGMVIFFYLLFTWRWSILRRIHLVSGLLFYIAIVSPWYLGAEARNPGFLRYYFWDEHFVRFLTENFDRNQPWYYFLIVLFVGFLPWSVLVPLVIKDCWKNSAAEKYLFLILWATLPILFFSLSKSKLPHYILPVFPALSLLTAKTVVNMLRISDRNKLILPWLILTLSLLYLALGAFWPMILPRQIRQSVSHISVFIGIYAAVLLIIAAGFSRIKVMPSWKGQSPLYWIYAFGTVLFVIFVAQMMIATSLERSAEKVARAASSRMNSGTQIVFYDTYLAGMPFYLRAERPVWIVTHTRKKETVISKFNAAREQPEPNTPRGPAVFDFDEFGAIWKEMKVPMLVIVKEKNVRRLAQQIGMSPKELARVDGYVLIKNL